MWVWAKPTVFPLPSPFLFPQGEEDDGEADGEGTENDSHHNEGRIILGGATKVHRVEPKGVEGGFIFVRGMIVGFIFGGIGDGIHGDGHEAGALRVQLGGKSPNVEGNRLPRVAGKRNRRGIGQIFAVLGGAVEDEGNFSRVGIGGLEQKVCGKHVNV